MSAHAKCQPSAAYRWMSCTAAPGLEATLPDKPSTFAAEGTRAHKAAEWMARQVCGLDALDQMPETDDLEMYEAADVYATFIKETYLKAKETCSDVDIETEIRLDLTEWIPEGFGTADCLIVADGTMHVIDFKYGKGVAVEAQDNAQMMIYALGALGWASLLYEINEVKMHIVQPRINNISTAEMRTQDLLRWGEDELKPKARIAAGGTGEFRPSEDACRFCKANGSCKAQADYFVDLFEENEDDGKLKPADAGEILQRAAGMKDWLARLEEAVKDACLAGAEIPGWKLVEGRTRRQYTDEAEIEKRLRSKKYKVSDIYEKKLLGISKMEKLLGKKKMGELIGDLIEKPKGSPTLVPESDKRPPWAPEAETLKAFDED